MKKFIIGLCLVLMAGSFAFADSIDLGNFPLGKWLDHNYNAVWEFSTGTIKITNTAGDVIYCDFSEKTLNDWKIGLDGANATLTFECPETGRMYKLTKGMSSQLTLEIDREGQEHYKVVMDKHN